MRFIWPILLLFLTVGAYGAAGLHGSGPVGCALRPGFADGCTGAPEANALTVQHSDFFTAYALQSGQTYTTRPAWNVPGVDYPVGINALTLPPGITPTTLKDPSTAPLPSGCQYISTGGNLRVSCNVSNSPTFNGFDFSLHGGIALTTTTSTTGTVTIMNCKFRPTTFTNTNFNFDIVQLNGGTSLIFKNNYVDGNGANYMPAVPGTAALINYVPLNGVGTSLWQYNAFLNAPPRWIEATDDGGITMQYNYSDGLNYPIGSMTGTVDNGSGTGSPSGTVMTISAVIAGQIVSVADIIGNGIGSSGLLITTFGTGTGGTGTYNVNNSLGISSETLTIGSPTHGDGQLIENPASNIIANVTLSYNTEITSSSNNGSTSIATPNEALSTPSIPLWQLDHNVLVANAHSYSNTSGGRTTSSFMVGDGRAATFTTVNWDTNYLDPTGSFNCFFLGTGSTAGTLNQTGNINLLDSSTISDQTTGTCHGHQ